MFSPLRLSVALLVFALAEVPAVAQISFTTAVDLALKNSPRVKAAESEVEKAQAALEETKDVYIPTLVGGSGLGYSYGFPLGQPSVFNFTSQSLIFNYSQQDYIRAARASLNAANLALRDARQAVAEDASITYLALERDQERQAALADESGYAGKLVTIVQDRLDAGQDTPIDLTTARLTAAQIRLARMRAEDDTEADRAHLARLTGLPAAGLSVVPSSIPHFAAPASSDGPSGPVTSPSQSSPPTPSRRPNSRSPLATARYLWRPQIYFVAQYSLFAKFNNYDLYYNRFQYNNAGIGVDIRFPVFDSVQRAKARESAAEAARAQHEADAARDQFLEGRLKVRRATSELAARAEVADLDQQLAKQQLDVMLVQLTTAAEARGSQMTPKDEQNSRIAEREKYLAYLDAGFQMRQAQINLMRQTGELENWLKSAAQTQALDASKPQ